MTTIALPPSASPISSTAAGSTRLPPNGATSSTPPPERSSPKSPWQTRLKSIKPSKPLPPPSPNGDALRPKTASSRSSKLKMLLEDHIDDIARIITLENGKTFTEAKAEMRRAIENA